MGVGRKDAFWLMGFFFQELNSINDTLVKDSQAGGENKGTKG